MTNLSQRIQVVLGAMSSGPRPLIAYLTKPGPDFEDASQTELDEMVEMLLAGDPNGLIRVQFSHLLRGWDNIKDAAWASSTKRNTTERRQRIHDLLKSDKVLNERIDAVLPFYSIDEPIVVLEKHTDWYEPQPGIRDYYWKTYSKYLRSTSNWDELSVLSLDNTTRAIVECLANPESTGAYASRGLVMGYVQSGKTANFTGVVARAADAGYRLIIVLAGTWNILRNQTQRRLDKELLGKEFLKDDDTYQEHPPKDWNEFLEHGFDPGDQGYFTWERITRPDLDFKRLKGTLAGLEYYRREKSLPLYNPANLHHLPVKLLVVKKHSGILANLVKALKTLQTKLVDLPTLVIDDESDQAGLNTVDPRKSDANKERSRTNERIVELLRLFPRGQYVGYTATPYANALVDPDDPEDLFPKDFIVSLERPIGYMGVSDFFEPEVDFDDLDPGDYSQREVAFIRRIASQQGKDDGDLILALRSYVLAGGLKVYREERDPDRYRFRHHTMLVHTSSRTAQHSDLADRMRDLWDRCAFNSPTGVKELEELWKSDFRKVSTAQGAGELIPAGFKELLGPLGTAIHRIEKGASCVLVVNKDSDQAPDFAEAPVWKIIVGGNKLSRGYTIEGLTVSYYRRVTNTADTLMQMGRWFGFRRGYRDLVRVFLGVAEGKKQTVDLVAMFKQVCFMEERFREEIRRYVRNPAGERITPRQIPPLISVIGQLPPTAKNKMFNAVIQSRNYGGQWSMPTMLPEKKDSIAENQQSLRALIAASKAFGRHKLGGSLNTGASELFTAEMFTTTNALLIKFLIQYRWLENEYKQSDCPVDIRLQIEFLRNAAHGIKSWIIIAPQRDSSFGDPFKFVGAVEFAVKHRGRVQSGRFGIVGEPNHRRTADFLASVVRDSPQKIVKPNPETEELMDASRGVMLLYPIREEPDSPVSVGFELLFPTNNLPFDVNFTVRTKEDNRIIV